MTTCERTTVLHALTARLIGDAGGSDGCAASHAIAGSLGHQSLEGTEWHYSREPAVSKAATAQAFDKIGGEQTFAWPSAEGQLGYLDESTHAELLALLAD